jgi:hypothetical protein
MTISNLVELSISLCLEAWLIVLLVRRDARTHFPLFFAYAVTSAPITVARLLTANHYLPYFYVYWTTTALLLLLGLAAVHEVFRWVYEAFYEFTWFRLFYYGVIGVVLVITSRNALVNPPVQAHPLVGLILDLGIAINFLRAGIACLFYALMRPLSITFRRYPHGVVLGFLVSSVGSLIGYLPVSIFGTKLHMVARFAPPVAYIIALAVWISAFIVSENEQTEWTPPMSPDEMLQEIRRYWKISGLRKDNER